MMIKKFCGCMSKYQDEKLGKNMRWWNVGPKQQTCTVCGRKLVISSR